MPDLGAGLPAAEALWCLLKLKGQPGSLAGFRETRWLDGTGEAMVPHLAAMGIQARPVQLREGDLGYLALPTLVQLKDATWLVLKARNKAGFLVLGAAGPACLGAAELQAGLSAQALDLSPGLPEGKGLWGRLRALLAHHRAVLGLVLVTTLAIQLLGLVTPALTSTIMNRALPDGARSLLTLVALGVVLMALFHAWIAYVRGQALLYWSQRMDLATERGFLEHVLSLPFPELRSRPLGVWLQAFGGLLAAREVLADKTLGVLLDGTLALVLLGAMVWMLPGPAVLAAAATLVMAGATVLVGRAEVRLQTRQVEVHILEQGYLAEVLNGIATLKAAGGEGRSLRRWQGLFRQGLKLSLQRGRLSLWANTAMATLDKLLEAALMVWGGLAVVRGALDLGTFLAFLQLTSAFLRAVLNLVGTYLTLLMLAPQLAKASAILELAPEPPVPPVAPSRLAEPLVMEGVWFRYRPEGPWVLNGYHLDLAAGAKLWLAGPSGWGKSTILRLLAGLDIPQKGQVLVGGQPPSMARHRRLYLPQFVRLHAGSILENLKTLSGGAPLASIQRAAALSGLEALVEALPMGFKTILPPGGGTLSGGQRQWVAITAAMASARGVLLLDEPMASIDPLVAGNLSACLQAGAWTLVAAGHEALKPAASRGVNDSRFK